MAQNNWDKKLNRIGRTFRQEENREQDRKDFISGIILMLVSIVVQACTAFGLVIICPLAAGALAGAAADRLLDIKPRLVLLGLVIHAVVLLITTGIGAILVPGVLELSMAYLFDVLGFLAAGVVAMSVAGRKK